MTTKVLCTFGATYAGGTLRVLTDGLPHLNRNAGIDLAFGDIYEREDIKSVFRGAGIAVTNVGIRSPPYTSVRDGFARQIDRGCAVPRHCLIAHRLGRATRTVDVVYVHTYKELVLAAWQSLSRRRGARIVWHCHGLDEVPPFTAQLARLCASVIAISNSVAMRLLEIGVPGNRIVTVLNAINDRQIVAAAAAPPIRPLPARRESGRVILVPTASVRATKGIHVLLEAAQSVPELEIWIAGDQAAGKYTDGLMQLSQSVNLRGRVHFIGFRSDIYSVMRCADMVCAPSVYQEGFGLVAAEAMALGKPLIVSNRGALPEIVQHGENGIVIDPDRPQDLTVALRRLIGDPEYGARLGAQAASHARERFSYERWSDAVAGVLTAASVTSSGGANY